MESTDECAVQEETSGFTLFVTSAKTFALSAGEVGERGPGPESAVVNPVLLCILRCFVYG